MSILPVRRTNQTPTAQPMPRTWDPFRQIRDLMTWDPWTEIARTLPEDRAFTFAPAFEVSETPDSYLFKADVPGVKEQDLEVTLTGNRLNVSGKRESEKEEKNVSYYTWERSYGSFNRSFTLPEGISETAKAEMKDGVLTIRVPKGAGQQARKIAVQHPESKARA